MPTWTPMCKAMQVHCEPFFTALERWRQSGDGDLLRNRLALCETAFEIMNDYYQVQQKIEFDLICENNDIPLEPEKIPTAGKEYTFSGDRLAYNAARTIVPEHIFNRVGLFFQTNLLRGMAGFGDSVLAMCNTYNRHSILAAIEKLFRISNDAGKAHFAKRILFEGESTSSSKFKTHPTVPLSANGVAFATFIMDSLTRVKDRQAQEKGNNVEEAKPSHIVGKKRKEPPPSTPSHSDKRYSAAKKTRNNYTKANYPKEEDDDDESEPEWTSSHKSVGTKVANYFDLPEGRQLFRGAVVLYAPPSKRGANDQLYHIRWEDSDEEDYDEAQFQTAISLFEEECSSKKYKPKPSTTTPSKPTRATSSSPTSASSKTRATRQSAASASTSSSTSSSPRKQSRHIVDLADTDKEEEEEQQQQPQDTPQDTPDEDSPDWTTNHPSIGTKVAAVFVIKRKPWLYHGTVTRYCPPSTPEADDQLYHIQWEDDDEQDYDEDELQRGVEKYAQTFGQSKTHEKDNNTTSSSSSSSSSGKKQPTKKHSRHSNNSNSQSNPASLLTTSREPSDKQAQSEIVSVDYDASEWSSSVGDYPQIIGRRVAVYFPPSGRHKTLFTGVVTKYAKETSSVLHTRDQLYHVVFDDGDVCDLDEDGYQQAIALYNLHMEHRDTHPPEEHSLVHDDDNEHVQLQHPQAEKEVEKGVGEEGEDKVEDKVEVADITTSTSPSTYITTTPAAVSSSQEVLQVDEEPTDQDPARQEELGDEGGASKGKVSHDTAVSGDECVVTQVDASHTAAAVVVTDDDESNGNNDNNRDTEVGVAMDETQ